MPPWVTGLRSASRRTVTSVVSRIGIASTSSGSRIVATVAPVVVQLDARASAASRNPSSWLPASPMKTRAPPAGRRLNGRKPSAGEGEREREDEHEVVLVHRRRVDREVDARDRRERRGEAVHVVEQVERVRDPDEPEERDRDAEQRRSRRARRGARARSRARRRRTARRASPAGSDGGGRRRGPARKTIAQPARIPASSQVGSTAPTASASSDAGGEAGGDRDPAERRRRPRVPALAGRLRNELGRRGGGTEEGPQGERRDGQGGDRDDRFHGAVKGSGRPGPAPILSALVRAPPISGGRPSRSAV